MQIVSTSDDIFLIFPRKQDLTFHGDIISIMLRHCLQISRTFTRPEAETGEETQVLP